MRFGVDIVYVKVGDINCVKLDFVYKFFKFVVVWVFLGDGCKPSILPSSRILSTFFTQLFIKNLYI